MITTTRLETISKSYLRSCVLNPHNRWKIVIMRSRREWVWERIMFRPSTLEARCSVQLRWERRSRHQWCIPTFLPSLLISTQTSARESNISKKWSTARITRWTLEVLLWRIIITGQISNWNKLSNLSNSNLQPYLKRNTRRITPLSPNSKNH